MYLGVIYNNSEEKATEGVLDGALHARLPTDMNVQIQGGIFLALIPTLTEAYQERCIFGIVGSEFLRTPFKQEYHCGMLRLLLRESTPQTTTLNLLPNCKKMDRAALSYSKQLIVTRWQTRYIQPCHVEQNFSE